MIDVLLSLFAGLIICNICAYLFVISCSFVLRPKNFGRIKWCALFFYVVIFALAFATWDCYKGEQMLGVLVVLGILSIVTFFLFLYVLRFRILDEDDFFRFILEGKEDGYFYGRIFVKNESFEACLKEIPNCRKKVLLVGIEKIQMFTKFPVKLFSAENLKIT